MTRVFSRCFFGGALTALLVALAAPAFAGGVVYTSWGKAIGGYDPVAYFTDGKLYLNYSKGVQRQWVDGGPRTLIKAGDKNWPDLKSNLAN